MTRHHLAAVLVTALALPGAAAAQAAGEAANYTKTVEGAFEDITFAVEQAIINDGLVIDLKSHVGDMLSRTREDVGGETELFTGADIYSFCSALVSRQVMEAEITNIQFCPYNIFVYQTSDAEGQVVVGHRIYPGETMVPVNEMLTRLVDTATE